MCHYTYLSYSVKFLPHKDVANYLHEGCLWAVADVDYVGIDVETVDFADEEDGVNFIGRVEIELSFLVAAFFTQGENSCLLLYHFPADVRKKKTRCSVRKMEAQNSVQVKLTACR